MNDLDDRQIIKAVLAGDVEAYSVLVKRYQTPILNLMYRLTRSHDDALDLAQETFIKTYESLGRFKDGARFFPWLYTIGINHGRNFIRKRYGKECLSLDHWAERACLPVGHEEDRACDQIDFERIDQALQKLPFDYREAVILHFHEGCSMEDIAQALQLSVSGAKMRVHRGLKKLRKIFLGDER